MLFFDLDKIKKEAKNRYDIVNIIHFLVYKPIPKTLYDVRTKNWREMNFSGQSFLINPEKFLDEECRYGINDSIMYLELAAKRNYMDYKIYRESRLPIILSDFSLKDLKQNKLLTITDDYIEFNAEK